MFDMVFVRSPSNDERLRDLTERLTAFYRGNAAYYDEAEGDKASIYWPLLQILAAKAKRSSEPLRVLELGAGRTSFPAFLRKHGQDVKIDFVAQDINETNVDFYIRNGIRYVDGTWSNIHALGPFDLCFSTYVFEHLVAPHEFLSEMANALSPDGSFVIVCPKYGFPGYVPPAIRWLPRWRQYFLTCFLALSNIWTRIDRRPKFWICVDPAVFRLPWRRDNDAVHMVSASDVKAALGSNFRVRPFRLRQKSRKMRLLNNLILMSIVAERKPSVGRHHRARLTPPQ